MSSTARDSIGRYGIWRGVSDVTPDLARHLEDLGFGTLWLGSSPAGDLHQIDPLLDATTTLTVATGIVNVWKDDAIETAAGYVRIESRHPGRFLLGVGVGHPEATRRYSSPYETLVRYVDVLLENGVPADALVLAALGPKVLRLARDRTAGAHPYLVTPEHTRLARSILGTGSVLAPEHKVVLDEDPVRARALGRSRVSKPYLDLSNYTRNLERLGWPAADIAQPGSDALIDALVAHGPAALVRSRLEEHFAAGADHVAIQLLTHPAADAFASFTALATALDL